MIRPASEIEYPPSPALCTKARMIARMSALKDSSDTLMSIIAQRLDEEDSIYSSEIEAISKKQSKLLDNMRRIIG